MMSQRELAMGLDNLRSEIAFMRQDFLALPTDLQAWIRSMDCAPREIG
jgi:hypothetical protein